VSPVWAVVLAGGGGARFGGPKQFARLGGRTLLEHSAATAAGCCDGVVVVVPANAVAAGSGPAAADPAANPAADPAAGTDAAAAGAGAAETVRAAGVPAAVVAGGATRAESVRRGLHAVPGAAGTVVVADAAHPLASPALFRRVVRAVEEGADGAVPGLPLTDLVRRLQPDGRPGTVAADVLGVAGPAVARDGAVLVQMPQAFRAVVLRAAHADGAEGVEDSTMVSAAGGVVVVVPGEPGNLHVTTAEELALAARLLPRAAAAVRPCPEAAPPAHG
jgi:2-C-methyl-D-erythritol 4-phosphate cytidylyltransferase